MCYIMFGFYKWSKYLIHSSIVAYGLNILHVLYIFSIVLVLYVVLGTFDQLMETDLSREAPIDIGEVYRYLTSKQNENNLLTIRDMLWPLPFSINFLHWRIGFFCQISYNKWMHINQALNHPLRCRAIIVEFRGHWPVWTLKSFREQY